MPAQNQHRSRGQPQPNYPMASWLEGSAGVQDRLIVGQYSYPSGPHQHQHQQGQAAGPTSSRSSRRPGTSLAMTGRSHQSYNSVSSSASSRPPSLVYSPVSESSSSQWSVSTHPHSPDHYVDLIDEQGNVVRTPRTRYTCLLEFLPCAWETTSVQDWRTHCNNHCRGRFPEEFVCPHCGWTTQGRGSWAKGLNHVESHFIQERRLDHRYRDKGLCKHLWDLRIISDATYRTVTEPAPFKHGYVTTTHDPRQQRRYA